MIGPKVAPNPDHANDTISKNNAVFVPRNADTDKRDEKKYYALKTRMTCLSVASFLMMPSKRFLETAEAAISRYESDELMVAAKIPAMLMPATIGNAWNSIFERLAKTFSAPLLVIRDESVPKRYLPSTPMNTAEKSEMTNPNRQQAARTL